MAASTRRARRGGPRATPEPAAPPTWMKRQGIDFRSLCPANVVHLLETSEGRKGQTARRQIAPSYVATLKSSDPDARSSDGLSKKQIVDKLEPCVKIWWSKYDEAMGKFREQNVEAPAPAAVELPAETLETYKGLSKDQRHVLIIERKSKSWATNQRREWSWETAWLCELLRDQAAADPSVVLEHPAPAPKYVETRVAYSRVRGALDTDTVEKWLRGLQAGTAIEVLESYDDARIMIRRTLPTLLNTDKPARLREALAEQLGRPATPDDVRDAFTDKVDELKHAWGEYEMVPAGFDLVTVDDLRHRLEVLEARAMRRANNELGQLSEERSMELHCHDMYYTCAATLRNWSRDLAVALGEGVADYAEKLAQLKHNHQNYFHWIRNITPGVAASLRARRRTNWSQSRQGAEHDNVPKVRDARVGPWKRFATPRGGALNYKPSVKPQG